MSRLLSKIKAPNDVKKLAANELPELCDEIREEIISTVADNGGHLASNLGVVEDVYKRQVYFGGAVLQHAVRKAARRCADVHTYGVFELDRKQLHSFFKL